MSPDARYLEDQECWHHGRPGEPRASWTVCSAQEIPTVTAIPLVDGGRAYEPQVARPDAAQEARQALHRLSTNLRQSIDAQQRALADIGDLMEALR